MKATGKPFLVVINTRTPGGAAAKEVKEYLLSEFGVDAAIADCQALDSDGIAELLKELLDAVGYADGVVVESVAIFTNKDHRCANESMQDLYTVKEALGYLSRFAPKNKRDRKRMKRTNGIFFEIFNRYSLSRKSAAAKNNKNLPKKK
jgi:hypothetical protein